MLASPLQGGGSWYAGVQLRLSSDWRRCYFGLIDGSPPGVPGGGMTGMLSPAGGGLRFICGSTPGGGVTTPPDRPKSELLVPLAGGAVGGDV